MPRSNIHCVDDYIGSQPNAVHASLELVRFTIRKALPAAEEVISYNMPTYKLHGKPVLNLAAWKKHYALYGCTAGVLVAFRSELASHDVVKGTIRFPWTEPVPADLIGRIAKFRAKEVAQQTQSKATERKRS